MSTVHHERCAGCGWSMSVVNGLPGKSYHPDKCHRCHKSKWERIPPEPPPRRAA